MRGRRVFTQAPRWSRRRVNKGTRGAAQREFVRRRRSPAVAPAWRSTITHNTITGDINPYLRAVGRLIVNFNALEHTVRQLAWSLINIADDRPGHLITDRLELSRLEDLVKALYLYRVRDEGLREEFTGLLDKMQAVSARRNEFTHAFLRVPNEAVDLSQVAAAVPPTRKRPDYLELVRGDASAAVEQAATEAYALGTDFENLLERTRQVLGAV